MSESEPLDGDITIEEVERPQKEMLLQARRQAEVPLREPGDVDAEAYTASVRFNHNAEVAMSPYEETLGKIKRIIEAASRDKAANGVNERRASATRRRCDDVLSEATRRGSYFEPYLTPRNIQDIGAYIDDCCENL